MATVPEALTQARQWCQAGYLDRAEPLCRQILRAQPAQPEALFLLGGICHRLQKLDEAQRCFQRVLRVQPRSAETCYALGLVFQDRGDLSAAESGFREAARLRPGYVAAHSSLGLALQAQGKLQEAEARFREVLRLCPDVPAAHAHLGGALQAQRKLEEAEACYRQALRLNPDFAAAHNNLGNALLLQGKLGEAAACFAEALRLEPDFAEAQYNLGHILQEQGRLTEAAACYQRAIRLRPGFARAHNALGMVQAMDDQPEPALECFRHALHLQPNLADAHANLGFCLLEEGRREEAVGHFREALRHEPHCIQALAAVAFHGLYPLTDAELGWMRVLLADSAVAPADASRLHCALGSLSDRAGAYDEAFAHFHQANLLRRRLLQAAGMAFNAEQHRTRVERLIGTCDAAYFQRIRGLGRDTQRPVFIVGMPRSGTSLVEQILASHPDVFGAGELKDIGKLTDEAASQLGGEKNYPDCLCLLDEATAGVLADKYLEQLARRNTAARRVTDKMPMNFEHLGLIAALFPKARIIHCVRDPLDVCLSCYFQYFQAVNFTWDLEDLGQYYREYERLMVHWRAVLPLPFLEVVYEELVDNLEAVSRRLVSFCGLDWDERCLAYHQTQRAVRTVSLLQVRQPVYKSSVGRWKRYAAHLRPLMDVLDCSANGRHTSVHGIFNGDKVSFL